MAKGKFHELLAVVNDRVSQFTKISEEAKSTFQKKDAHFDGQVRTYQPLFEDGVKLPPESRKVVTTVAQKLGFVRKIAVTAIDAVVSKEETNSSGAANAELTVKGQSLGNFSATALLSLENNFTKIRNMYNAIPTRDADKAWDADPESDADIYRTETVETTRVERIRKPITLHAGNEHHAPQVQLSEEPTAVGTWSVYQLSGKLTSGQKAELLSNIDDVLAAIKRARARANSVEAKQVKVANSLFDIIHGDVV
jgi:hypothetical protein